MLRPQSRTPSSKSFGPLSSNDPDHEERVFRRVRGILNKLTIEKFDSLVDQLLNVGISNENILRGIIILLYEKALDETKFASMYAQVCLSLSETVPNFELPDLEGKISSTSTFVKLLLKRCQDEFDNRSRAVKAAAAAEALNDKEDQDQDVEARLYAEQETKNARRKMLGNIKFIGELGKLGLVHQSIMHECIKTLVTRVVSPVPEDIECLCKLMTTVGHIIDHEKGKNHMDVYFERMAAMREQDIPMRVKFMIDDVFELRSTRWVSQRAGLIETGPMRLDDIRLEAQQEQVRKGGAASRKQIQKMYMEKGLLTMPVIVPSRDIGVPSMPGDFQGMTRKDALLPSHLAPELAAEAYGESFDPSPYGSQSRLAPRSTKLGTLKPMRPDEVSLRPEGPVISFAPRPQAQKTLSPPKAAIGDFLKIPSPTGVGTAVPSVYPSLPQAAGSSSISPVNKKSGKEGKKAKPTKEQLNTMVNNLLTEFLSAQDFAEACRCVKDVVHKDAPQLVAEKCIFLYLEKKPQEQDLIQQLFVTLSQEKILSEDQFQQAVLTVLEYVPDLSIDIPLVYKTMGRLLSQAVGAHLVSFKTASLLVLSEPFANLCKSYRRLFLYMRTR